jgi:predicted ATPase
MITAFCLENFRSYRKATLPLASLTLLVGANASGKSNAIEGMRLLSGMATGQYLTELYQSLKKADSLRGSLKDLVYNKHSSFVLGCTREGTTPWSDLLIALKHDGNRLSVASETIRSSRDGSVLYDTSSTKQPGELEVAYETFGEKISSFAPPQTYWIRCRTDQAIFTQLTTPARFHNGHARAQQEVTTTTEAFRQDLERILFLDPNPHHMRDYSYIEEKDLHQDASNLSSVLYALCSVEDSREQLLGFVRSLPEQDIRRIDFVHTPRNEVMVRLAESFGNKTQLRDAPILSDGTLRILAVAAALLSVPRGSLVVIEEIDNGVHPSRANLLMDNIQRTVKERQLSVLLTAHNPALLDALSMEAIPNVIYCYRDPKDGDSQLVRLESMPDYPEIVAQGPVGSLMTRGIIERYLKRLAYHGPEEKTARALEWLKAMEREP